MRVDPAIAALRGDRAPQLRAQAAMFAAREAWRARPEVAAVLDALERYGRGADLSACPALADLFAAGNAAGAFVDGLCVVFAAAVRDQPFAQLPFRHGFDGVLGTLLLARSGRARLTLVEHEPGEREATTAMFSDAVRHDAVVAGEAAARLSERLPDGTFDHRSVRLVAGDRRTLSLAHQALAVGRVERRLVTLRLHRDAAMPEPVREYALADGRLLQQSAGDIRHSRHQMMVALLGRMERRGAAPLIAEIAAEEGSDALRWEALREALALDTAAGFAALCRITRSAADPLAAPAGALRAQLVEAHPELLAFEEAQCPA